MFKDKPSPKKQGEKESVLPSKISSPLLQTGVSPKKPSPSPSVVPLQSNSTRRNASELASKRESLPSLTVKSLEENLAYTKTMEGRKILDVDHKEPAYAETKATEEGLNSDELIWGLDRLDEKNVRKKPLINRDPEQRYKVEGQIAQGGLGRILKATDQTLGRPVAVKELLKTHRIHEERFLQEAHLTANLEHPSIIPIHDLGVWPSGKPYYAMKLVDGRPLHEVMKEQHNFEGRLGLLPYVLDACEAIAYAHSKHIIHRDLKPSNILVGSFGETLVIDWGLAKNLSCQKTASLFPQKIEKRDDNLFQGLTKTGTIMGTPMYMSPEQARGEEVDKRTDVYALGTILYELLCNQKPYPGNTQPEFLAQLEAGPPIPLEKREPKVPNDLRTIVKKAMAYKVEDRYPSAKELAEEILRFQKGLLVHTYSYSFVELLWRWFKHYRTAVFVGLSALLIFLLGGAWSMQRIIEAKNEAVSAKNEAVIAKDEAQQNEQEARKEKKRTEQERRKVEQSEITLLTEQGRQQLLQKNFSKAAVYLNAAYQRMVNASKPLPKRFLFLLSQALFGLNEYDFSFKKGFSSIVQAEFSQDGSHIFTLDDQDDLYIHESSKHNSRFASLRPNFGYVITGRFSPDGKQILIAKTSGTIEIWDLRTMTLLTSFKGIPRFPRLVEFSPDGSRIVVINKDRTAKLWNTSTGVLVASLGKQNNRFPSIAFSPEGSRIVITGKDGTAKLWNTSTGALIHTLKGHTSRISFAAFSPNGSRVVTISKDNTAKLWNASTGTLIASFKTYVAKVTSKIFSPDGSLLVTAKKDGTAKIWNTSTGALLHSLKGHTSRISFAAFSPNGSDLVIVTKDGIAKIWNAKIGNMITSLEDHPSDIISAAFSPDGSRLVTANRDNTAKIWNTSTGALVTSLRHNKSIFTANFSPDGRQILTRGPNSTATLWKMRTNTPKASLRNKPTLFEKEASDIFSAAFSPDGSRILAVNKNGTARIWSADTYTTVTYFNGHSDGIFSAALKPTPPPSTSRINYYDEGVILPTNAVKASITDNTPTSSDDLLTFFENQPDGIISAKFNPDGSRIVTTNKDGTAKIWSVKIGALLTTFGGPGNQVISTEFSPDGSRIAVAYKDGTTKIWNTSSDTLLQSLKGYSGEIISLKFNPDGSRIATLGHYGAVGISNTSTGAWIKTFHEPADKVISLQFSPDGNSILTISEEGTIKIWNINTDDEWFYLLGHTARATSAKFSPDGSRIVTASEDDTAKIWDAKTGTLLLSLQEHIINVTSATFSPDGTLVVTTSLDRTIKVWDAKSGIMLTSLEGHLAGVTSADFTLYGTHIVTTSLDGTAKVWKLFDHQLDPKKVSSRVESLSPWNLVEGRLLPKSSMKPRR